MLSDCYFNPRHFGLWLIFVSMQIWLYFSFLLYILLYFIVGFVVTAVWMVACLLLLCVNISFYLKCCSITLNLLPSNNITILLIIDFDHWPIRRRVSSAIRICLLFRYTWFHCWCVWCKYPLFKELHVSFKSSMFAGVFSCLT